MWSCIVQDRRAYRATTDNGEMSLASSFPEAMLDLLDRLIADDPKRVLYGLAGVTTTTAEAAPALRGDER